MKRNDNVVGDSSLSVISLAGKSLYMNVMRTCLHIDICDHSPHQVTTSSPTDSE